MTIKTRLTIEEETEQLMDLVQELTQDPTDQLDLFASLLDYTEEFGLRSNLREYAQKELERIQSLNLPKTFPPQGWQEASDG